MTLITKPDMEFIWASGGAIVEPSDVKKQTGWTPDVPPHQWENWIQNRQDTYLAHINQRGIPQWDGNTEYEPSGLSYVQGSNGVVYKSVAASGPATTAQDPTTDATDTYWSVAFASNTQATESVRGSIELATTAEAEAGTDDERAMTPLKVKQAIEGFASSSLPLGYFSGFTLSNNAGAPTATVDTDPGTARSSDNTVDITLVSAISGVLQSSGAWVVGTGQNKLDTGAKANSTTYHVFVIRKTSDGTGDILFSLSPTAPTMPSGYAGFRWVNAIRTDASGNIIGFLNRGDMMYYKSPIKDVNLSAIASNVGTYSLSLPSGVVVEAVLYAEASGDQPVVYISSPDAVDVDPIGQRGAYVGGISLQAGGGSALDIIGGQQTVLSNSSGQIRARFKTDSASTTGLVIVTAGWRIFR
jgi:hypothetical protein